MALWTVPAAGTPLVSVLLRHDQQQYVYSIHSGDKLNPPFMPLWRLLFDNGKNDGPNESARTIPNASPFSMALHPTIILVRVWGWHHN